MDWRAVLPKEDRKNLLKTPLAMFLAMIGEFVALKHMLILLTKQFIYNNHSELSQTRGLNRILIYIVKFIFIRARVDGRTKAEAP